MFIAPDRVLDRSTPAQMLAIGLFVSLLLTDGSANRAGTLSQLVKEFEAEKLQTAVTVPLGLQSLVVAGHKSDDEALKHLAFAVSAEVTIDEKSRSIGRSTKTLQSLRVRQVSLEAESLAEALSKFRQDNSQTAFARAVAVKASLAKFGSGQQSPLPGEVPRIDGPLQYLLRDALVELGERGLGNMAIGEVLSFAHPANPHQTAMLPQFQRALGSYTELNAAIRDSFEFRLPDQGPLRRMMSLVAGWLFTEPRPEKVFLSIRRRPDSIWAVATLYDDRGQLLSAANEQIVLTNKTPVKSPTLDHPVLLSPTSAAFVEVARGKTTGTDWMLTDPVNFILPELADALTKQLGKPIVILPTSELVYELATASSDGTLTADQFLQALTASEMEFVDEPNRTTLRPRRVLVHESLILEQTAVQSMVKNSLDSGQLSLRDMARASVHYDKDLRFDPLFGLILRNLRSAKVAGTDRRVPPVHVLQFLGSLTDSQWALAERGTALIANDFTDEQHLLADLAAKVHGIFVEPLNANTGLAPIGREITEVGRQGRGWGLRFAFESELVGRVKSAAPRGFLPAGVTALDVADFAEFRLSEGGPKPWTASLAGDVVYRESTERVWSLQVSEGTVFRGRLDLDDQTEGWSNPMPISDLPASFRATVDRILASRGY